MYTFIVNPNARSGLGAQLWTEIESVLNEEHISYNIYFTRYRTHGETLAQQITSDGREHTLIILGGDGTINEVISGIHTLSKVTLGYIPIGSSNDFARAWKLSKNAGHALANILHAPTYREMNIAKLTYKDKCKRFAVSAGIGFDAGICHQVAVSKLKRFLNKLGLGKLSYTAVALQRMLTLTPQPMTLHLDDGETLEFQRVYFATAMNLCYEGGGFKFCPKADPSDGYLDLIVISDIPKLKALLFLSTAFFGFHTHFKGVHIFKCKEATLTSTPALPVHTDGEAVFLQREVHVSLEPENIKLIVS